MASYLLVESISLGVCRLMTTMINHQAMAACAILMLVLYIESATSYSEEACRYPAQCIPLEAQNVCLGAKTRYSHTSLNLVNQSNSVLELHEQLSRYSVLQAVPRCWEMIHSLLCAVYMPKCEDSHIEMYSKYLCEKTRESCAILPELIEEGWPSFLDCDQPYFSADESCTVCRVAVIHCVLALFCIIDVYQSLHQ